MAKEHRSVSAIADEMEKLTGDDIESDHMVADGLLTEALLSISAHIERESINRLIAAYAILLKWYA